MSEVFHLILRDDVPVLVRSEVEFDYPFTAFEVSSQTDWRRTDDGQIVAVLLKTPEGRWIIASADEYHDSITNDEI